MKIKIALTFFLLSFTTALIAQSKYVTKAELSYASENFFESAELCALAYTKLTRKGKGALRTKAEMAFKTAESYRLTERYRDANEWYDRAILLEYQKYAPEVYLYNGEMLLMMAEYKKSQENFEEFLKLVPGDQRALAGVESCKRNKDFIAEKTRHIIENQTALNSKQFDMAPMFGDRKTTQMYYGSGRDGGIGTDKDPRTGEPYMDLWVSGLDKKGNWTEPFLVKGDGINTEDNEGTVCFDARFKTMFFTRCPNVKKQNLGCDIW